MQQEQFRFAMFNFSTPNYICRLFVSDTFMAIKIKNQHEFKQKRICMWMEQYDTGIPAINVYNENWLP